MSINRRPRVALDIETSLIYGRQILAGIARYMQTHRPWSIHVEQHELGSDLVWLLKQWNGDGIITRQATPETAKLLKRRRIAVVDLGDIHGHLGFPQIGSTHRGIGQMVAEHFFERGFENFACCGFSNEHWSDLRRDGFVAALELKGFNCLHYESPRASRQAWEKEEDRLADWLESLPKPVGLFATNDLRGQQALDACGARGVAVPEQVAVMGVDNDELLCGLCNPPLSSVIPNPERIGAEAAALLDRMMHGESPETDYLEIPPRGIAVRQSSDVFAVTDPMVASALQFIREHACEGITVRDVLQRVPVSRSWLERSFRKYINRSPQSEIRNVQIKRCKDLLRTTPLSLERIAGLAGFEHPEYMSVVFKRETSETPGQYRKRSSV